MFGPLGFWEVLIILVLALLIFGPKKLPEMGRTIGRALGEFRRASNDLKRSLDAELDPVGEPRGPATRQPQAARPRPAIAAVPEEASIAVDEEPQESEAVAEPAESGEKADGEAPPAGTIARDD